MKHLETEDAEDAWENEDDDVSDLKRRTFLERHDWIPWIAAAITIGAALAILLDDVC